MSSVNLLGLGMTLQKPTELEEPKVISDSGYSLTELNDQHWMYKEIVVDFKNAGLQVLKIEHLKNRLLWQKYINGKKDILERKIKDPEFSLNEKYLYHGTSVNKDSICTEGLDQRMAKRGCFGRGLYFSDYPQKCVKYAEKGKTDSLILLERVILGESKIYPDGVRDKMLQREPEKELPFTGWRFYDSVTGRPKDHTEFVVYSNDRALIECIITYSSNKENKSNLSASAASNSSKSLSTTPSLSSHKTPSNKTKFSMDSTNTHFSSYNDDHHYDSDTTTDEDKHSNSSDSDEDGGCSSDSSVELTDDKKQNNACNDHHKITTTSVVKTNPEALLAQKKKEFIQKTGEFNEHVIESFLLATDLDVNGAVQLFLGKDKKRKQMEQQKKKEEEKVEHFYDAEEDVESENARAASPLVDPVINDPDKWKELSEGDKEAIIETLTDNFLTITSLGDNDANRKQAQKILLSCGYDLDLSIVSFFDGTFESFY